MKKIISILSGLLLSLCFIYISYAAEGMVATMTPYGPLVKAGSSGLSVPKRQVLALTIECKNDGTFTEGTYGTIGNATYNGATTDVWTILSDNGYRLESVICDGNHAGTEPNNDTDLTISNGVIDILGGGGTDMIDNNAENEFPPLSNGTPKAREIASTSWIVDVIQPAVVVNSAIIYVYLIFSIGD